ncbi:hypothetical protein [Neobacillus massiliamazoniensis]|nr:hypothetical protein [Neobacillus massiliamazoniensis]
MPYKTKEGKQKVITTPEQRLGIAKKVFDIKDILNAKINAKEVLIAPLF